MLFVNHLVVYRNLTIEKPGEPPADPRYLADCLVTSRWITAPHPGRSTEPGRTDRPDGG